MCENMFSIYSRVSTSHWKTLPGLWCQHAWLTVQPLVHVCSYTHCLQAVSGQNNTVIMLHFDIHHLSYFSLSLWIIFALKNFVECLQEAFLKSYWAWFSNSSQNHLLKVVTIRVKKKKLLLKLCFRMNAVFLWPL